MKQGTFRFYVSRLMGPWVVGVNQILTDSTNFIQTQVNSAFTSSEAAAASQAAALLSQQTTQSLEQQTAALQAAAQQNETNSAASLVAVQAILHTLNTIWLGTHPQDPTTDGNGDPIPNGAMYLNNNAADPSVYNHVRVYSNGAWVNVDAEVQLEMSNAAASAAKAAASASAAADSATTASAAAVQALTQAGIATDMANAIIALFPKMNSSVAYNYLRVNAGGTAFEYRGPTQTLNDLGAAPLTSPQFQGVPLAPTPDKDTNTQQVATSAFVLNQASSVTPLVDSGTGAIGSSFRYARADHVHPTDQTRAQLNGSTTQQFSASLFKAGWGVPSGGVATTMGYSFYNDGGQDTGLFSDGDGILYIYNNAIRSVVFDASGNSTFNKVVNFNSSISVFSGIRVMGQGSEADIYTRTNTSALYIQCGGNVFTFDAGGNFTAPGTVVGNYGTFANGMLAGNVFITPTPFVTNGLAQGAVLSWNSVGGSGSTDFINFRGAGAGGFKWWNTDPNTWVNQKSNMPAPLMNLDSTGRLTVSTISAASGYWAAADSNSTFGTMDLYAVNPYVNLHKNGDSTGIQIISYDSVKLSFRQLDGSNEFATFSPVYWNLAYASGLARFIGQGDGNLVLYTKANAQASEVATFSANANLFSINTPLNVSGSGTFGNGVVVTGNSLFNNDLILPNISIRSATTNSRLTFEPGGHFSFWDKSNNLIFWVAANDASPSVNVNGNLYVNGGNYYGAGINLTNGGTSSVYQDLNTSNVVLRVQNGTTINYAILNPDGSFTANNLRAANNGYVQGGRILAGNGNPGAIAGFTFVNEGSYDTGMFSVADGVLDFWANNTKTVTMTSGGVAVNVGLTMNADLTLPGRRLRSQTGSSILFETGGNISIWDAKGNELGWFDGTGGGTGLTINKVNVNGILTAQSLVAPNNSQSTFGNLELVADTPLIDFHYNNTTADYNVRLVNDGDNQLTTTSTNFRVGGNVYGLSNFVNIYYGQNNGTRACFQNDGNFVFYTGTTNFLSINSTGFWTNVESNFDGAVYSHSQTGMWGVINAYADLFMNGNSIRTANGDARMTFEAGGHFSFWDKSNNLIFWIGTNDAAPNVNVNGDMYVNGGSYYGAGLNFTNGGTSSIYQDKNTNNIVMKVYDGTNNQYGVLSSIGTFSAPYIVGNTYIQSNGRITAANGLPGGNSGYTFVGEGSYDTGMFSSGDGLLYFYRDGTRLIAMEKDNILNVTTTMKVSGGDLILPNRRIWGGSGATSNNTNMLFEAGGHISIYDNSNTQIWWWSMSDGNTAQVNSSVPIQVNNWIGATSINLPKDSYNTVGNWAIYAASPFVNFFRNADNGGLSAVIVCDGPSQVSIRNGGQAQIATFSRTVSTMQYSSGGYTYVLQNDGNAVWYKGSNAFASIRDDGVTFRTALNLVGPINMSGYWVNGNGFTFTNNTNGGVYSQIYQDVNKNNLVFRVSNNWATIDDGASGGRFNIGQITAQQVLVPQGNPNSVNGFSFLGDSGYDSGMFSNGDGQVGLWCNGSPVATMTQSGFNVNTTLNTSGTINVGGDVVLGNNKWLYADTITSKSSGNVYVRSPLSLASDTTTSGWLYMNGTDSNGGSGQSNWSPSIRMRLPNRDSTWFASMSLQEVVGNEIRFNIGVVASNNTGYWFNFSQSGRIDANVFNGNAVTANYADLAELYLPKEEYEPGTLVKISESDEYEIEATESGDDFFFGVISTAPALLMNKDLKGGLAVALTGRVPTKVIGPIKKGQPVQFSDVPGIAMAGRDGLFGFALETNLDEGVKLVEVAIGGRSK